MSNNSILENAISTEQKAYSMGLQGESPFVMSVSLLITILRNVHIEDVEALATGDEDALEELVDRLELGTFVYEHVVDYFQEAARMEFEERNEADKDAWEVEMELRQLQIGVA
jgi:hypothetical protein